jgi:phage portal protein BeeE
MGAFGDAHPRATVTEDQVRQIIQLLQSRKTQKEVARQFGVNRSKALLGDETGSTSHDQQTSTPQFAVGPN